MPESRPPSDHGATDAVAGDDAEWNLAGNLLIATTTLTAEPFARSVVLICAHSLEDGAMGIVIHTRLHEPSLEELFDQLGVEPAPPRRRIGLCAGGPCDVSRGFVLHSSDWDGEGSLVLDDTMSLTASLDVLKAVAEGTGPALALLALGHASWAPGQLEREMEENAWISAPATAPIVFDGDHDTKWRRALATLRIDPILLSETAGHA